jgi:transposase
MKNLFLNPIVPQQRIYEAVRAIVIDGLTADMAAEKFGYKKSTIYSLIRDLRSGKRLLFPEFQRGPADRQTPEYIQQRITILRKKNLSVKDIINALQDEGYKLSKSTVERVLTEKGFSKLGRRTLAEQGKTINNQLISGRATTLDFKTLQSFKYDCPVAGVFFFIPYLIESGILDIVKNCGLPESSAINSEQAGLSMLLLKLIGNERLSHAQEYDHESGLALFAGLNFLPKSSYLTTYSCRTSEDVIIDFQQQLMKRFQEIYPDFYRGNFINLDFHSIPHFGEQSQMEKVWCGARGKAIKGANTVFAQDSDSNAILYTRADILRKDEAGEIKRFVDYWRSIKGDLKETLVFDCKVTSYGVLDQLAEEKVLFITLRKRNKKLVNEVMKLPKEEWQKCHLPIPKRKHQDCLVHVSEIPIPNGKHSVRQIIVTGHGRAQPMFIITNNLELSIKDLLVVYAKRWHIENKFAELVSFFNLNALSSPLMIRIHFDILWTVIADTLYRKFSHDLPRFEKERANTLFRRFIDMPGQVIFNGKDFVIKIRKRAHTPILLGVKKLTNGFRVPWLDNRLFRIEWTA